MTTKPIRLLLVDDHLAFRQPLAFMFSRESDLTVVGEAGSLAEARELLLTVGGTLDVVLVDLQLPDGDGVTLINELQSGRSRTRVLVLTADPDKVHHARAIDAGASGVLNKTAPVTEIAKAIRTIHVGESIQSAKEIIELLRLASQAREHDRQAQATLASLTPRERQVLEALAQGLDNKAIAERLFISHDTARTHVVNLLAKLDAESRLQAAIFAIRNGIGSVD
jgi:DNA-binding NarL/FixJ family response regulator